MIDVTIINTPAVVRHYIFANTPRYLFRNLRQEPSVSELADTATVSELLRAISEYAGKTEREPEDMAIAYAMLVALSFKNFREVRDALAGWTPQALSWAGQILAMIEQSTAPTTMLSIEAPKGHILTAPDRSDIPSTLVTVAPRGGAGVMSPCRMAKAEAE